MNQVQTSATSTVNALLFINQFLKVPSPDIYSFIGKPLSNNITTAATIYDTATQTIDTFNNLLVGVKVAPSDVALMIPNVAWQSNTVYNQYDSAMLNTLSYHVCIQNGAVYNVFLCLDNNFGGPSTIPPTSVSLYPTRTGDNYLWKFVSSIPVAIYNKFKTTSHIPYVANTQVVSASVMGTVENVRVIDGGLYYNNYFTGQFLTSDLVYGSLMFGLPEVANSTPGFYTGCILKIVSPSANTTGQFATITGYTAVGNTRVMTLGTSFSELPAPGTLYEIYPEVMITPSGYNSVPARARALINPQLGNTVQSVEILTIGSNHIKTSSVVVANSVVGVLRQANVYSVVSPPLGYGGNLPTELRANAVGINSVIGSLITLPVTNDFSQFGVIKDPTFNNVTLPVLSNNSAKFVVGEQVTQYTTTSVIGTGQVSGTTILGSNTTFSQSVVAGNSLLIQSNTQSVIVQVGSVVGDVNLTIKGIFSGNISGSISAIRITGSAIVQNTSNTSVLVVGSCTGKIQSGQTIYGTNSQSIDTVSGTITVNREQKTFDSFRQTTQLIGNGMTTPFLQNETISYSNTQIKSTGTVHSLTTNNNITTLNVVNNSGNFPVGSIVGNTSGATLNITDKYYGDLTPGSGTILFASNIVPVNRQNGMSENIRIILEF